MKTKKKGKLSKSIFGGNIWVYNAIICLLRFFLGKRETHCCEKVSFITTNTLWGVTHGYNELLQHISTFR